MLFFLIIPIFSEIHQIFCGSNMVCSLDTDKNILKIEPSSVNLEIEIILVDNPSILNSLTDLLTVQIVTNPNAVEPQIIGIGDDAFMDLQQHIGSIIIPDTITYLGRNAFHACKIKEIFIPKSVTRIDTNCFFGCRLLQNVTFDENSHLEIICEDSF